MADTPKPPPASPSKDDGDLNARITQLESALKASRAALPQSLIPEHGAGYGSEVEETWSLADQEEARAE